jgi:hypothetical protein
VFEDWQKGEDGKVEVYPLVAFETLVPHGVLCGLKVHYLESPAKLLEGDAASIPLIMTIAMARKLASALMTAANEAENGPRGEVAH